MPYSNQLFPQSLGDQAHLAVSPVLLIFTVIVASWLLGYLLPPGLYYSGPFILVEVHELSSVTTSPSSPGLQRRATKELPHSFLMPVVNGMSSGPSHGTKPFGGSSCGPIPTFSLCHLLPSSRVTHASSTWLSGDHRFVQASESHLSKQLIFFHPLGCSIWCKISCSMKCPKSIHSCSSSLTFQPL